MFLRFHIFLFELEIKHHSLLKSSKPIDLSATTNSIKEGMIEYVSESG